MIKKNVKWIGAMATVVVIATMLVLESCTKDETPPELTLVSLMAGSIDLNGASSATGVPVTTTIVATFSTTLDTVGLKCFMKC